jgi:hypothetical protein
MKIRKLFAKDIDRKINPAVVVTEQSQVVIDAEIEEYVFTAPLIDNLYKFLDELMNRKDGKTAIWINGYYGSGKSHFIKYVHYCINGDTSEAAFNHFASNAKEHASDFSDATPSNILQLKKRIQQSGIDNIMFNIDAVSGQQNTKNKLPIIILNQFNEFRGYNQKNIALAILVEKHLDKLGKFEEFKQLMNTSGGYTWERDASTLVSLKLNKIIEAVHKLDPEVDQEALRSKLKNPDDITIEGDLVPELNEFLADKDDSYRLVFLIDEVSQYIGSDTNLLLNLQTIIEEVGSKCNNKVWFATTAQQSLDQMIENTEISGEDFGKILGRFETRISLQSQDAAYITKKRILDKTSNGVSELKTIYNENKDAIHNQFNFSSDLYRGYDKFDDFALSYPFVPYQFRLISDVFESFSQLEYVIKEVRDNERSVLGITHFTVKKYGDQDLGYFVPFDGFFNEQFRSNLTHAASQMIDRAMKLDVVQDDPFARRVVFTLFMISNLSDSKKITFPADLDNLTTLLISETDANRLDSQHLIQKVLDKLADQHVIREENGQFHFFKEDEIEVANLINNLPITKEDRLSELHDSFFMPQLKLTKRFGFGVNNFNLAISFDDKQIYAKGEVQVLFSFYDHEDPEQRAIKASRDEIIFCVGEVLNKDKSLLKDFIQFVKTKKYLRQNFDSAVGVRRKTLDDFSLRNKNKLADLKQLFANAFKSAPVISGQQVLKSGLISSGDAKSRYDEALKLHFSSMYKKHDLAKTYATSSEALKTAATSGQTSLDKSLTAAEGEVDTWLNLMDGASTVSDVVKEFSRAPYGWKDIAILHILIEIGRKEHRRFEWRNEKIDLETFYKQALKSSERAAIVIQPVEAIAVAEVNAVKKNYRSIFNADLQGGLEVTIINNDLLTRLELQISQYKPLVAEYDSQPFRKTFETFVQKLEGLHKIRDPKRLFDAIAEQKEDLKQLSDNCKELAEFVESHFKTYESMHDFHRHNRVNYESLEAKEQKAAESLAIYLRDNPLPFDEFPVMKKIYEELEKSIKELVAYTWQKAINVYDQVYCAVNDYEVKNQITGEGTPSLAIEEHIKTFEHDLSISSLKLAIEQAPSKQAKGIGQVDKLIGKKSIQLQVSDLVSMSRIDNEAELDEYIEKLQKALRIQLKAGNSIILQ